MLKYPFSKRLLVSITGRTSSDWKNKLLEIEKFKIKRVALFLEFYAEKEKKKIYEALLSSNIKKIPLVHIRNDMKKSELEFLEKNFKTKCFTIHENSFKYLNKWKGFHKKLFLELDYNNHVPQMIHIEKIGGFCIDLSHFKASKERFTNEFLYTMKKRKINKYFKCNHLNGYSPARKKDLHTIRTLKNFNYLKTLPKFVFGKYIALEMFNSIKDQLKYKKYLINIIKNL